MRIHSKITTWSVLLATAVAVGSVVAWLGFAHSSSAATGSCSLTAASAAQLATQGLTVSCPTGGPPAASEASAISTALAFTPGATVQQTQLVHLSAPYVLDPALDPPIDRDVWAVSVVPQGGITFTGSGPAEPGTSTSAPLTGSFEIIWIDAQTGAFMWA